MEKKEKKFDIKRLWTTKVFGIPLIIMMLINAVFALMPLVLYCPADDFMCMSDARNVIKDIFTK